MHFKTPELFLASVAAYDKNLLLPPYAIIQWIEMGELGSLIISDEVKAVWLAKTRNLKLKNDKYS